jgi:hypothetical protein
MPRSFSELGRLVDQLARSRDVQGLKVISEHVWEKTGGGPGRSAWGKVLFGDITPTPNTMRLFWEAFELDEEEATVLAWVYAYGEEPPKDA